MEQLPNKLSDIHEELVESKANDPNLCEAYIKAKRFIENSIIRLKISAKASRNYVSEKDSKLEKYM